MSLIIQFVELKRVYGPQNITRFNLFTNANISGASNPGYSSGDALQAVQEVAETTLSSGYGIDFAGLSREEVTAGNQTLLIFLLCVVFVYFFFSAQYEYNFLLFVLFIYLTDSFIGDS